MQTHCLVLAGLITGLSAAGLVCPAGAQQRLPLAPDRDAGQTVTPAFEGWYKNPDGTFSLSFGYYNRNSREALDISIGPGNFISPADSNRGQPTRFEPGRHWGVFAVKVPADFGDRTVTWTLSIRGETYVIPGSMKRGWEIDALEGEGASGNIPPVIKFEPDGAIAQGPGGGFGKPLTATVGRPIEISVWITDEVRLGRTGRAGGRAGGGALPSLVWFKHQGVGNVTFNPAAPRPDRAAQGKATTTATFSEPGVYVLRLRATEGVPASAGHAQCCWSNGFLKVTVSR